MTEFIRMQELQGLRESFCEHVASNISRYDSIDGLKRENLINWRNSSPSSTDRIDIDVRL